MRISAVRGVGSATGASWPATPGQALGADRTARGGRPVEAEGAQVEPGGGEAHVGDARRGQPGDLDVGDVHGAARQRLHTARVGLRCVPPAAGAQRLAVLGELQGVRPRARPGGEQLGGRTAGVAAGVGLRMAAARTRPGRVRHEWRPPVSGPVRRRPSRWLCRMTTAAAWSITGRWRRAGMPPVRR